MGAAPVEAEPVQEVTAVSEEVTKTVDVATEEVSSPDETAPVEEFVIVSEEEVPAPEEATPVEEVAAPVEEVEAPVEEVAVAPAEVVTPVEEVAAQVEEVTVAVAAVLEEFATPAEAAMPAAEKPKGINLPTTELTDDWMDDDMGSINSEDSEEEVDENGPVSDSEPEKETVSQEIFSLTEVSEKKEEVIKEPSAEEIVAMQEAKGETLAPAEA